MAKKPIAPKKKQNPVTRYFRETVGELRKVNWPTRKEATRLTGIVIVVVAFMGFLLGVLDSVFTRIMGWIITAG
ncbi:MAG: preprotein translocase subunit SecE [Anaerolineales bacterium]|nr:preprotein translocase subunit SecE [Anaerolineales bacterium]